MKQPNHYVIVKRVACDLLNGHCTEEVVMSASIKPDCESCSEYQKYIKSGLSLREYMKLQRKELGSLLYSDIYRAEDPGVE